MARSLYEIAVSLTMVNNAGRVLDAVAHQFVGIHRHINAATAASNRFRTALAAAGTAIVGSGLLAGMGHLVERGAELNRILGQMRLQGWGASQLNHAMENAFSLSRRYPSLSAQEILEMTKEMSPVLGNREEALHISDTMARLMVAMQHQFGPERAAQFHSQVRAAVRAGELSANTLRPERFEQYVNLMARALQAFGGTVTPHDFMQATRYGRAAALNWSDEFTGQILPTIMQELDVEHYANRIVGIFNTIVQPVPSAGRNARRLTTWRLSATSCW
jgi:hypothetical protein